MEEQSRNENEIPIARGPEFRDTLLKDFSAGQRDYIIHKLYPIIKKTLVHFVAEATMQKQIFERAPDVPKDDYSLQVEVSSSNLLSQNNISRQRPHTGFPVYSVAQNTPKNKNIKMVINSSVTEKSRLQMYKTQNLPKPLHMNNKQTVKRNLIQKNVTKEITSPHTVKQKRLSEVSPQNSRKTGSFIFKQLDMVGELQRPSSAMIVKQIPEIQNTKKLLGKNQPVLISNSKKQLNKTTQQKNVISKTTVSVYQIEQDLDHTKEPSRTQNYPAIGQKKEKVTDDVEQHKVVNYGDFGSNKANDKTEQPKVMNYGGFGFKKANDQADQPKVMNYGGFGTNKVNDQTEKPKVMNYKGFGTNKVNDQTEQPKVMNYGGFGTNKLNDQTEQPKVMNYGDFGSNKANDQADQPKVMNNSGLGLNKVNDHVDQPKVMNYGGFGTNKVNDQTEQPKVMNYGGFGSNKANDKTEKQKVMSYGNFGSNNINDQIEQPKVMNYGGFCQKQSDSEEPKTATFGNYSVTAQLQNQSTKNKNLAFNSETQFKQSLLEVLGSKQSDERIFTMATSVEGPSAAYLQKKRGSVFQKNVELHSVGKFVAPVYQKSEFDKDKILNLLRASFLTKSFDSHSHVTLANAMYSQHFNQNEKIIQYGDIGDKYYILATGFVKVIVYQPGTSHTDPNLEQKIMIQKELSSEPEMIGFGEIALLLSDKRTATVISMADGGCDCWVLSGDIFKHIIAQNTLKRRDINLTYLNQVTLFKNLETYEKLKLIDGLKMQIFKSGEFVFHEGATGDEFFIIEAGECECLKTDQGMPESFQQIRVLAEGSHFGEVAIMKNVKRTLSVRAISEELKLLVLSREAFQRILGSIKDYLMEDYQRGENNLDTSIDSEKSDQQQEITSPKIKKPLYKQILPGIAEQDDNLEN